MKNLKPVFANGTAGWKAIVWSLVFAAAWCGRLAHGGNFYAGTTPANVPWPGGIVPYEFTNTLTAAQKETYIDGLREWELAANVKFVPHISQTRWILFGYNTNDLDHVTASYNPQIVTVSSLSRGQVCHEMGHSFGFTHENIRVDQTNYITVLTNNINYPSNIVWFVIDPTSVTNGPYDFESVMHLAHNFDSSQPDVLDTQLAKPPYQRYQVRMGNYALSPGDRAALAFLYGSPAVPLSDVVTNTADVGPGTLRAALYYVTDHPGSVVTFNIPTSDPGYSNGVFNIHLTGHLPPLVSNGMVIDGSTQPGFASKPLVIVDGSQILPETFTSTSGLLIYSGSNQVKNISFQGFNFDGLTLLYPGATNNTIAGCWLGLDSTGSNAVPNAFQGILIDDGASNNIIGGTNVLFRNVLSGNGQYGIWMQNTNPPGNLVIGNYIGTDASGSFAVSNALGGIAMFDNAVGNVIGGTNTGARNVISGNISAGIWISGSGVSNNIVKGNYIGLDASGTIAVSNTFVGVYVIGGTSSNTILNNIISGNFSEGLRIADPGTTGNRVQGNFIGTDFSGMTAVPNAFLGLSIYTGATNNVIGGTTVAARNVISGNFSEGLRIQGAGASYNLVQGNFIGTDATGMNALGNGFAGVTMYSGATSNIIGGIVAGARNTISGNNGVYGVVASDPGTSGNIIEGNYVGLSADGSTSVPNYWGVLVGNGATNNILGGTSGAARNIVSGNTADGVFLTDPGTSGNFIQGNFIGTDPTGAHAMANGFDGIYILIGASSNWIGGTSAGAGNVISGNSYRGIYTYGTNAAGNLIQGNFIGLQADGVSALGNGQDGIVFFNGAGSNIVGLDLNGAGAGNKIAFNSFNGVYVGSDNTDNSVGNTFRGNSIYSNSRLGINLDGGNQSTFGVTSNHLGGAVSGPNDLQNYPVFASASVSGGVTILSGTFNSTPSRAFLLDFYRNSAADPSGFGQGQIYLGSATVTTDGSGNAIFGFGVSGNFAGQNFSATATDTVSGDTSEFNQNGLAVAGAGAPQLSQPFTATSSSFSFKLTTLQTNRYYRLQASTNLFTWVNVTNFIATTNNLIFADSARTNFQRRFYRAVSP